MDWVESMDSSSEASGPSERTSAGSLSLGEHLGDAARLRCILETVPGERCLRPAFGCRVHRLRSLAQEADRYLAAALIEEDLERHAAWAAPVEVRTVRVDGLDLHLAIGTARGDFELCVRHRCAEALLRESPIEAARTSQPGERL